MNDSAGKVPYFEGPLYATMTVTDPLNSGPLLRIYSGVDGGSKMALEIVGTTKKYLSKLEKNRNPLRETSIGWTIISIFCIMGIFEVPFKAVYMEIRL